MQNRREKRLINLKKHLIGDQLGMRFPLVYEKTLFQMKRIAVFLASHFHYSNGGRIILSTSFFGKNLDYVLDATRSYGKNSWHRARCYHFKLEESLLFFLNSEVKNEEIFSEYQEKGQKIRASVKPIGKNSFILEKSAIINGESNLIFQSTIKAEIELHNYYSVKAIHKSSEKINDGARSIVDFFLKDVFLENIKGDFYVARGKNFVKIINCKNLTKIFEAENVNCANIKSWTAEAKKAKFFCEFARKNLGTEAFSTYEISYLANGTLAEERFTLICSDSAAICFKTNFSDFYQRLKEESALRKLLK